MDRQPREERRLPKNYALVLDVVRAAGRGTHQTAAGIYALARERQRSIGFATVHRSLTRLCALREIVKIEVGGGEAAYYEQAAPPHAHLFCDSCGRVVDIDYALAPRTVRSIAGREGVLIEAGSLTFRGACRDCAKATAP